MASEVPKRRRKRITVKPNKPPNPLFERWLEEWKNEAASKGSDVQYCFGKALSSLRKYPLPLKNGRDCGVLDYFGNRLCIMLDRKLAEYRKTHPEGAEDLCGDIGIPDTSSPIASTDSQIKPKKKKNSSSNVEVTGVRKNKPYLPSWRSGPYAILLALHKELQKPNYPVQEPNDTISLRLPVIPCSMVERYHCVMSEEPAASILKTTPEEDDAGSSKTVTPICHTACVTYQKNVNPSFTVVTSGYMTKSQLQVLAQPHCDKSFSKPDPGSFYTAWSSMSGLIKRGLVLRNGCPAKFSLSGAGTAVAQQLRDEGDATCSNLASPDSTAAGHGEESATLMSDPKEYDTFSAATSVKRKNTAVKNRDHKNSHTMVRPVEISHTKKHCKVPPLPQVTADHTVILVPGSFDVILLVDKQETTGVSKSERLLEDATIADLSALGTLFELRHLKVSDFTWVCRERATGQELVLPYIVERKRMDDLAKSIRDGRYHEQKFRMKQSGVQNLIYLVESHGDNTHTSLPLETLNQATINTQVVDKFTVKTTSSHRDSMHYLSIMTRLLTAAYCNKTIIGCHRDSLPDCHIRDDIVSLMTFSEFNNASSKTKALSVRDLFIKQLVQLHGLSVQKAQAIVEHYHTPRDLMAAYQAEGSAGEKLLANIRYGSLNHVIGPVISRTIHQFYTKPLLS